MVGSPSHGDYEYVLKFTAVLRNATDKRRYQRETNRKEVQQAGCLSLSASFRSPSTRNARISIINPSTRISLIEWKILKAYMSWEPRLICLLESSLLIQSQKKINGDSD